MFEAAKAPGTPAEERPQTELYRPKVVFPVIKGRQIVLILEWTNPDPSTQGEGFDDVRIATETLFHETNPDHKHILTQYVNVLECILARWFRASNSLLYQLQELSSYETENEREDAIIKRIVDETYK
jgi:hypothetical protein